MNYSRTHIIIFGRLFVLIFFLVNAGFTTVLEQCAMQSESCCGTPTHMMACNMGVEADAPMVSGPGSGCHVITLFGGRANSDGLWEKDAQQNAQKSNVLPLVSILSRLVVDNGSSVNLRLADRRPSLHPRVGKYILHEAFLN
ncbi:MAG: hypothetical protein OEM41_04680 [Ignavibacteria bacterium]|nr:hypothetical protein [Ignavibacteria bacterium]